MAVKAKKKLCWNCEARVNYADENCTFCGVYLSPLNDSERHDKEDLFAPPYRSGQYDEDDDTQIPAAPYAVQEEELLPEAFEKAPAASIALPEPEPVASSNVKISILPLILLLAGSMLFLFGMALVLFSQHGTLTLRWSSDYWFAYFLCAIPLLVLGWRQLDKS